NLLICSAALYFLLKSSMIFSCIFDMYISACYLYVKIFRSDLNVFGNRAVQIAGESVDHIRSALDPVRDQQIPQSFLCNRYRRHIHGGSLLIPAEQTGKPAEEAFRFCEIRDRDLFPEKTTAYVVKASACQTVL